MDQAHVLLEIDRSRSTGKKPLLGGSLFSTSSGSVPSEFQPLVPLQTALSKASMTSSTAVTAANVEYDKMHDPDAVVPTPPVHAAKLSQLLKSLASAESSVSESMKARQALITGLEKLLDTNRSALTKEQALAVQLSERKAETEEKKREVEDAIMRGFSEDPASTENNGDFDIDDSGRPQVEALTPPPVESLTPIGSPSQSFSTSTEAPTGSFFSLQSPEPTDGGVPAVGQQTSLSISHQRPADETSANGLSAKKRKVTHGEEDYAQFASGDLDADVAELLKQESPA
jgi:regulator of Ty1 transposition protein 103